MRQLFRGVRHATPTAGSLLVAVLLASLTVAMLLAYQAITAARQRRAVSDAVLRQYAQLALWDFSRQAQRDIESAVMHALTSFAHAGRHTGVDPACDCAVLDPVEQWFDILPDGTIRPRVGEASEGLRQTVSRLSPEPGRGDSGRPMKMAALEGNPRRFVAIRWEPHLTGGRHVGLEASLTALSAILVRSHQRAALLPAAIAGTYNPRSLVHIRVTDATGLEMFTSPHTRPGPHVVDSAFVADLSLPLSAQLSMTPAFVASLGPEHGAGPSSIVVMALVALNALLVGAGLWQLARERQLASLRANFIAGVSHELRTPLAQIRLFSETLLLDRIRNGAERRRALEIIGHESLRLTQLVDNVLQFHRPGSPAGSAGGVPIDMHAFVHEVVESFHPIADTRQMMLSVGGDRRDVAVRGDRAALRQVLLNLLDNAVKYGPAGQRVTVQVRSAPDAVIVIVEDQGPGVAPADRARIFNAFERGRDTRGTGGAGIGLAVVRQIVEAHGGSVSVDSMAEAGARFTVSLPAAERDLVAVAASPVAE